MNSHRHPIAATPADEYVRKYVLTGTEKPRDFERFAEKLAAEQRASTGRELPGNQGFSVAAHPAAHFNREEAKDATV